jgi:uncharacterized protein YciI
MTYFVIRSEQGPAWNGSSSMREQRLWTEHAAFINSLLAADKMILGGPIGDGSPYRVMVVFLAGSEAEVRDRLSEDPWYEAGVLRVVSIETWDLIATNDKLDVGIAQIANTPK